MKKIVLTVLCVLLAVFTAPLVQGKATEELGTGKVEADEPSRMTYLDMVGADLLITDDGVATVHAQARSGSPLLTNLLVVAELQQQINGQWTTIRTYRYFTGDNNVFISETHTVARGYYYRVVNTSTAYAGNDYETRVATTPEWNFYVPGTYPG